MTRSRLDRFLRFVLAGSAVALCVAHGWLIWTAMVGRAGLMSGLPPWRDDHPLYYHSALVSRHFLAQNGTTAGYDPAFMAGYPKSVVFPASSTLPELCVALTGGKNPAVVYKVYVLVAAALIPWLILAASGLWETGWGGACVSVALFLVYVWTDFPMRYAQFGMLPYLLAIPLGLVATGAFGRFCESGSWLWWLGSMLLMTSVVLIHFTSAMVVSPAALAIYLVSVLRADPTLPRWRHAGVWLIPVFVVALNAFWWLPALWLSGTKGTSDFAFAHPEGFLTRMIQIVKTEARIERWLIPAGVLGLGVMLGTSSRRARSVGLLVFAASGFFWGYVSAVDRRLDFLQPGRHTFAFYSALAVAAGYGLARGLNEIRRWYRADLLVGLAVTAVCVVAFRTPVQVALENRVFARIPILYCEPSPWLQWVMRNVRKHVRPGERLLYEEGGFAVKGADDPFQGGRFSGLLADTFGIELIGGPYLHASLTTNFTQFGEGKLFGKTDWDRDWFVRHARLYRPSAILCWTPKSRAFCLANPDLIDVKVDEGTVLIGRVIGFEGAAISGKAEVEARPGKLRVTRAEAGVDGTVVLRYHSVPCLRSDPPVVWDSVYLEDDPVPFIRMRPTDVPVTFGMEFPPRPRH